MQPASTAATAVTLRNGRSPPPVSRVPVHQRHIVVKRRIVGPQANARFIALDVLGKLLGPEVGGEGSSITGVARQHLDPRMPHFVRCLDTPRHMPRRAIRIAAIRSGIVRRRTR